MHVFNSTLMPHVMAWLMEGLTLGCMIKFKQTGDHRKTFAVLKNTWFGPNFCVHFPSDFEEKVHTRVLAHNMRNFEKLFFIIVRAHGWEIRILWWTPVLPTFPQKSHPSSFSLPCTCTHTHTHSSPSLTQPAHSMASLTLFTITLSSHLHTSFMSLYLHKPSPCLSLLPPS